MLVKDIQVEAVSVKLKVQQKKLKPWTVSFQGGGGDDEGRVSPAASQSPPPYIMMFGQIPVEMPPAEEVKPNFRTPPAKEMPEANRIIRS
jgi:hypothetical protein